MADALKQTLYWSVNPTEVVDDLAGTGYSVSALTAAGSHDGSDATYGELSANGDTVDSPSVVWEEYALPSSYTASGSISFVRACMRARVQKSGAAAGSASWDLYPTFNGAFASGSSVTPTNSYTLFTVDWTTVPGAGGGWHASDFTTATFGFAGTVSANSPDLAAVARMAEMYLEVWGPSGDTSTPSSLSGTGGISSATIVAGLVVSVPSSVGGVCQATDATPVLGAVSSSLLSCSSLGELSLVEGVLASGNALDYVAVAFTADSSSDLKAVARSSRSGLADQSDGTKAVHTFTAPVLGFPTTGTLQCALTGLVPSSLSGEGSVVGVRCLARVTVRTSDISPLQDAYFTAAGSARALVSDLPPQYTLADLGEPYVLVESELITTTNAGDPLEWGSGANSIVAQLSGWSFDVDYILASNKVITVNVSEAWIEVVSLRGASVRTEQKALCGNFVRKLVFNTGGNV